MEATTPREALDVDEPADWPVPRVDPDLDRLRYPPHGRSRFAEPRSGDYQGQAETVARERRAAVIRSLGRPRDSAKDVG